MSIVYGLITGLAFGFILQRGRLCFNSGFRDLRLEKDNFVFKTIMLAIALQMIAFPIMAHFGLIQLNPKPLNWIAVIVGASLFGMGMVLAGGCASGLTYRVGEGNTTSWLAVLFLGLTAWATKAGVFSPILQAVSKWTIKVPSNSALYLGDEVGPTIATLVGISPLIVAFVVAALILVYVFATKTTARPQSTWKWWVPAVLLLPVAAFGFWSSTQTGRAYGLGITGGWIGLFKSYATAEPLGWEPAEIIGIILGALITALVAKEFKFRVPKNGKTFLQVAIGGSMMGFGAVLAGGCNVGHFLTGIPQLAISSIVAGIFFILGNWAMTWFLYQRD